jgi:hypothetical protein
MTQPVKAGAAYRKITKWRYGRAHLPNLWARMRALVAAGEALLNLHEVLAPARRRAAAGPPQGPQPSRGVSSAGS